MRIFRTKDSNDFEIYRFDEGHWDLCASQGGLPRTPCQVVANPSVICEGPMFKVNYAQGTDAFREPGRPPLQLKQEICDTELTLTLGGDRPLLPNFQRIKFAPFTMIHPIAAADPPKLVRAKWSVRTTIVLPPWTYVRLLLSNHEKNKGEPFAQFAQRHPQNLGACWESTCTITAFSSCGN